MRQLVTALLAATLSISAAAAPSGQVNVNTATQAQLQLLPRVGPALAQRIMQARPIANEQVLDAVRGIGPATLELLRPWVCYECETTLSESVPAPRKPSSIE